VFGNSFGEMRKTKGILRIGKNAKEDKGSVPLFLSPWSRD